ncbi:MAG: adenylate/guanylate cyclase domain-containing protein [Actinomycetota bacterium]|nr:adenylate/guanylate cyclase domain-containing protein [Actinomycetota bacterium]
MAALLVALALPLAAFVLLAVQPELNVEWEHHPAHFWLVLGVSGVSVALGLAGSETARRLSDARLFLVSLAFLASAGFFGLHALATPGVLLEARSAGFDIAVPVGILVAACFVAASSLDLGPEASAAVMARQGLLRGGLLALLGAWAVFSVAGLEPLDDPLQESAEGSLPLVVPALLAIPLWALAAVRYLGLYRRRPQPALLGIIVAFALVVEAMLVVTLSGRWEMAWWEWHVLLTVAFGLVAETVRREYRRARSAEGAFSSLYLEHTIGRVDARYAAALDELMAAQRTGREIRPLLEEVAERHGLSREQARLLEQAVAEVRQIDELFRPYVSPQLATSIEADPRRAELGGEEREVSVLFADLEGFTAFSERSSPTEVIAMLNEYWSLAGPVVLTEEEGMIERFAGDAIMVVFNATGDQPDHALRAARAALRMLEATDAIARDRPGWPRFRAGVNTGRAIVGHVGVQEQRSFAAIGDTTNLAARLQAQARPGQAVIGPGTYERIRDAAEVEPLGPLELKGKREPVEAFTLVELAGDGRAS